MENPWKEIDLKSYESHMSLDSVFQLQTIDEMTKEQFYDYDIKSVLILGIAAGTGLEHIDKSIFDKVYGVDINQSYLDECNRRYPGLSGILETRCADLMSEDVVLPHADLLTANLLIEYIGYEWFKKTVKKVSPKYVSCIIQINTDNSYVSDSPYIHIFDRLDEVHYQMEESALIDAMNEIGYEKQLRSERKLPNGKKLVRLDFADSLSRQL